MESYQLAVIGAGPGGYTAAIRAAQLGLKTAVIENREVGGTCLNRGCIPTKTLLHSATAYEHAKKMDSLGVSVEGVSYDIEKIHQRKEAVSEQLRTGVEGLLKANKVDLIKGTAHIADAHKICISGEENIEIEAENIIIAVGGSPAALPIEGINLPNVLNSEQFLAVNDKVFKRLVVVGGGVIGVELGSVYASLGCEITILEGADRLLPRMDKEISQNLGMILKKRGVTVHTGAVVDKITEENGLTCYFTKKDEQMSVEADGILIAVGRKSNTAGLFDESLGLEMQRGALVVNDKKQTTVPNIYAIGDSSGGALAHQAAAEGAYAAEIIAGEKPSIRLDLVPACVYTNPEIATVGITADDAKRDGKEVITGKFIMSANGKSIIDEQDRGFVKLIFDKETEVLLGAQLMCGRATDMISELASAIANGTTREHLASVIRSHPTFSEGITEAAENAVGRAIHIAPARKR